MPSPTEVRQISRDLENPLAFHFSSHQFTDFNPAACSKWAGIPHRSVGLQAHSNLRAMVPPRKHPELSMIYKMVIFNDI